MSNYTKNAKVAKENASVSMQLPVRLALYLSVALKGVHHPRPVLAHQYHQLHHCRGQLPTVFDADSSQGVPHRRKTITVVDESQVELDEVLDVIREQEDEIALLQYQVEDLKDRFEILEMTANESERLLHQAVDSGARLKHYRKRHFSKEGNCI